MSFTENPSTVCVTYLGRPAQLHWDVIRCSKPIINAHTFLEWNTARKSESRRFFANLILRLFNSLTQDLEALAFALPIYAISLIGNVQMPFHTLRCRLGLVQCHRCPKLRRSYLHISLFDGISSMTGVLQPEISIVPLHLLRTKEFWCIQRLTRAVNCDRPGNPPSHCEIVQLREPGARAVSIPWWTIETGESLSLARKYRVCHMAHLSNRYNISQRLGTNWTWKRELRWVQVPEICLCKLIPHLRQHRLCSTA
jgi:hypothetical protein